jgi:hypothetical protein
LRIIWDDQESRFLAELTPGEQWRDDKDSIQAAGFQTDGPPDWRWYTKKASTLNKLRENKPKSGLVLTEVALSHYQALNQKEEQKAALKKQFKTAQKQAKKTEKLPEPDVYFDTEIGVMCLVVQPKVSEFTQPIIHGKSDTICIACGDPLYPPWDYPDICVWCDKIKLDKITAVM